MSIVKFDARAETERLQDAVRRHDRMLLDELVSERFALVSGRALGRLGKLDWITAALQVEWERFAIAISRVIDLDDVVVVDHDVEQELAAAPVWAPEAPRESNWTMTDVWAAEGGQWRLVCRHPELTP